MKSVLSLCLLSMVACTGVAPLRSELPPLEEFVEVVCEFDEPGERHWDIDYVTPINQPEYQCRTITYTIDDTTFIQCAPVNGCAN